ncbi:DNA import protein CedA1 [Thermogladius sp. 4427co]|uniref:DNA import protein CedA1 n=1 Tax=Thermogladius sp. 4427co TaxID=3450718 RepID=UPI003F7A41DE
MDIVEFVKSITIQVVIVAWALFFLSWVVGWALKGMPIPFTRVKKVGERILEDGVWAAFWLAVGSSVFALISYIASSLYQPLPPPPSV